PVSRLARSDPFRSRELLELASWDARDSTEALDPRTPGPRRAAEFPAAGKIAGNFSFFGRFEKKSC
ncbi:MAG: hypothetical protein J2P55_04615, partial [Rhizobiales bacterium]|nr:hypothetical protein [Hyphomicrobiales bacterium]